MCDIEKEKRLEKFYKTLDEATGIWTDDEGSEFVRKIREECEERLKKIGL
jgi:hypothetical protein